MTVLCARNAFLSVPLGIGKTRAKPNRHNLSIDCGHGQVRARRFIQGQLLVVEILELVPQPTLTWKKCDFHASNFRILSNDSLLRFGSTARSVSNSGLLTPDSSKS
jgi:hypothetical protein